MPTTKGIMGFASLDGDSTVAGLRVTSLGLRASQEVSAMETIDSVYDYTAYRLGPVRVEGDITFPVPVLNNKIIDIIRTAMERNTSTGQMAKKDITVTANYDHVVHYIYSECSVNTMSFSVNSEEAVEITMNLLGTSRIGGSRKSLATTAAKSPERVLTWNEIDVGSGGAMSGGGVDPGQSVVSEQVRNFSFEVNNNNTVFFGLNGEIFAQKNNIVAGKREITGSMEIAWNGGGLQNYAYTVNASNGPEFCESNVYITMDMLANCGTTTLPQAKFWGVIFNMEEISMTNDFFMGTQTWRAYGSENNSYKAFSLGGTPY